MCGFGKQRILLLTFVRNLYEMSLLLIESLARVHLLLVRRLLIELLNVLDVGEHAGFTMGKRARILRYYACLDWIMGETGDILALHATKVEVIATAFLYFLATFFWRRAAAAYTSLWRRFRGFSSLFLVQYYRVDLVKWYFDRILDIEIIVLARHSSLNLVLAAWVEVRGALLLLA